jgi:trimeric autotransporter adhesin
MRLRPRFLIFACLSFLLAHPLQGQWLRQASAKTTSINGPSTLALDNFGHLFVVEDFKNRIRRIDLRKGTIKTVAGNNKKCCYADGKSATQVNLSYIWSIAVDTQGNLFIGDGGQVRKVDARTGLISTVAGNGKTRKTVEGTPALAADFNMITGLAVDASGNLFIADAGQGKIFEINSKDGLVARIAGTGQAGFAGDGGPALDATFFNVESITLDSAANLYLTDEHYCHIRRIDHASGIIDTVVQTGGPEQNCPAQPGVIPWSPAPSDPAVDLAGNLYFVQGSMDLVSRAGANRENSTIVAGTGERGFVGDGGPATSATLGEPAGLAVDRAGNLYISEYVNNRIRRVDAKTGEITTIAGNGLPHRTDVIM